MNKFLYLFFTIIFSSVTAFASSFPSEGFADIVEPLMPAVVNINTVKYAKKKNNIRKHLFGKEGAEDPFQELFEPFGFPFFMDEMPSNRKATSLGSGFLISADGEIVTNHHVIAEADEIMVKLNNNKEFPAKVIGSDPKTDLALLKIETKDKLPFVSLGDSSAARVGDWIIAIGNPFGLGGTVTAGIISSKSRDIDVMSDGLIEDYIQTDAAINGGNSGGPMFNMHGEVIGVNTAILGPTGTNIGIGFAIPTNSVKNIITQLKTTGKIERGVLGIRIQDLTPELSEGLGIKDIQGVILASVIEGGAAEKSGLKPGDIIIEYNGSTVKTARKLRILVAETPLNHKVNIKILREGKEKIVTVTLNQDTEADFSSSEENNSEKETSKNNKSDKKNEFVINDVVFSDITKAIEEKLKLDQKTGIIVLSNKATNLWRILQPGDIIISVNQVPINSINEFKVEYEGAKKQKMKNIAFFIRRSGMTIYLALPL